MREATPHPGSLPGRGSAFLLHVPLGALCLSVCSSVFWGLDVSLEVLCFCLCAGMISIQCPRGLGSEMPGSAPLDV